MKQKLRKIVRPSGAEGQTTEGSGPQGELKDLLLLSKEKTEELSQLELTGNYMGRTNSRIRRNIDDFRHMSWTKRETSDQGPTLLEASSRSKDRLPSLETNPSRAVRSFMTQVYSRSVDKTPGGVNILSTTNKSYQFNTDLSIIEPSLTTRYRKKPVGIQALKPNIARLPSINRPESKTKEISKRMMDAITGRIKSKTMRKDLFKTEQGGIGVFLSDIGFTSASDKGDAEASKDIMTSMSSRPTLKPQQPGEELTHEVENIIKLNLDKLFVANSILSDQEVKEEQEFIYYIKLLYTDETPHHEFIYAINKKADLPYNLTPVPFNFITENKPDYYFTVSKSLIIKYGDANSVTENSLMDEWLREKLKFNQLKSLEFVRKFRKIKTLNTWKKNVKRFKRKYAAKLIEFQLPILDPTLSKPILEFRQKCIDLENLNYFYISTDRICNVEELKAMQDKTNDLFVNEIKRRDKQMNIFIRDIVKIFNQMLWNTAFADLSEELKGGLQAIKCPDPEIYDDGVDIEGQDLAFFHKLMTLNVPYRVKSKIRNLSHRLLSMPLYFDSLRMSSLMACYKFNVDRLREYIEYLQDTNTETFNIWSVRKQKPGNRRSEAYLTIYFKIDDSYKPKSYECITESTDVVILKGKTSAVEPLEFDYQSNFRPRDVNLESVKVLDKTILEELGKSKDLQELMNKNYMYDKGVPLTMEITSILHPGNRLIKITPNFEDLKSFLLKEYDDFLEVLSSFKKCSMSGEFNLYFKLLIHWANEDLRPDNDNELIALAEVIDEGDKKDFEKKIINPIENDYKSIQTAVNDLIPLALQLWRNSQANLESNLL